MSQNITLIGLDLDGTTLTRSRITPRTRKALEEAIRRGVHVVVATGRVYTALPADVFEIKGLEYVITSNGAIITDLRKKKVIHENCIGAEPLQRALEILREHPQYPIEVFTEGNAYIGGGKLRHFAGKVHGYLPGQRYFSAALFAGHILFGNADTIVFYHNFYVIFKILC